MSGFSRFKKTSFLMRSATVASIAVAVSIVVMKLMAWFVTGSLSLLTSLIDSFFDVASSVINFAAVQYALMPADRGHRFGHGKAEDVAAFAQSTFIAGSGLFIVVEGVDRLLNPHTINQPTIGIAVMLVSSVMTLLLVWFQSYVIRQTKSMVIEADQLHYKLDLLLNFMVIIAFLCVIMWNIAWIDVLFALLIAAYVLHAAWGLGKKAFNRLLDSELDEAERQKIMEAALEHPKTKAVHDLRTRYSGTTTFIQFHLELDSQMTLEESHQVSEEIEKKILTLFEDAEVLIHQDPEAKEDIPLEKERVLKA